MARDGLAAGTILPPYRATAYNAATASDNKIHDDDVARQYGFRGGLVPGVTVYAYMTRPVVEAFGIEWLGRGSMSARFLKPFYEGDTVTVEAEVRVSDGEGTRLEVRAHNQEGELCASGTAFLPRGACAPPPPLDRYPEASLPGQRPPATRDSVAGLGVMGSPGYVFDAGAPAQAFLAEVADDLPLYREKQVAHPGFLARAGNTILASNVLLGPWIHVSSDIQHYSLVHDADEVSIRGRVKEMFERKGHKFALLDVMLVANGDRPVMHIDHSAIYEPRRPG